MNTGSTLPPRTPTAGETRLTHIIYALQAAGYVIIVTWVLTVAALIINYVKREDVADTVLASHFRWQIRTFWFSLLWALLGFATYVIIIGWVILGVNYLWVLYRVIKGWLRLSEGKPMYEAAPTPPAG